MHPEKAKVVAGTYAGDDEFLLGEGGRGVLKGGSKEILLYS